MRGNLAHLSPVDNDSGGIIEFEDKALGTISAKDMKGVRYNAKRKKFRGVIARGGKRFYSNWFGTPQEASDWYKGKLEMILYGEWGS
jgi:hypothetical protein